VCLYIPVSDILQLDFRATDLFTPINAENLRKAHKKLESGNTIGKIVLSGF
jgi:NADPH:quinone reductase